MKILKKVIATSKMKMGSLAINFGKQSLLLKKINKRPLCLLFTIFLSFILSGCVPESQNITILYPDGEKAPFYNPQFIYPVVGSDYFVYTKKDRSIYPPTVALQILSKDHEVLYEYDDFEFAQVERGEMASDGSIWVSCEKWHNAMPLGRYTNGYLMNTQLLQIDPETGKILFQKETLNKDIYLTTRENRCYFYSQGKAAKKFLIFTTIPVQNASIYYRDIRDWDTQINVYTFDFSIAPTVKNEQVKELEFGLQEDKIVFTVFGRDLSDNEIKVDPLLFSEEIPLVP